MPFLPPNQQRQSTEGMDECKSERNYYQSRLRVRWRCDPVTNYSVQLVDWLADVTGRCRRRGSGVAGVHKSTTGGEDEQRR